MDVRKNEEYRGKPAEDLVPVLLDSLDPEKMISKREIEANPDKSKTILDMEPPYSIRDVQKLTMRITDLGRLISNSEDKCLPFFKTLKKYQEPRFVMEKVGGFEIEMFNGRNNFTLWQSMIKDLLIQRGLYATLRGKKPTEVDDTKWGDMKLRAESMIRLALAPEIKYDVLE
ncbi:hypothetical protein AgCh_038501 [Apium graveolens]